MRTVVLYGLFLAVFPTVVYGQDVPRARLVEELRIGTESGGPDYALSRVTSVRIDGDGSIYVSQPQENLIRVFDSEGRFVRRIGRSGEGPGEFRQMGGSRWIGEDTLVVIDHRLHRVSYWTSPGFMDTKIRAGQVPARR